MAEARGYSVVSLLVSLGLTVAGIALAARCLVICGRTITRAGAAAASLTERSRAGDFATSLASWSGCGEPGRPLYLERSASRVSFRLRPGIDGPETTVTLAMAEGNLTAQREGGRRWTVVSGCPPGGFVVDPGGFVTMPLGGGLAPLLPGTPAITHPLPWAGP